MVGGDGFDEWFDELFPIAARVEWKIVRNDPDAQDLASEACARALARWSKVGPLRYRDAWLLRVTTNLALDQVKRRPVSAEPRSTLDFAGSVADRLDLVEALR